MFNVGDLVRGNDRYIITNSNSVCRVIGYTDDGYMMVQVVSPAGYSGRQYGVVEELFERVG